MKNIKEIINTLNTGDLLLFHSKSFIGKIIQCFTKSKYCHIGMVLKDPFFIDKDLSGTYLWQSGRDNSPDAELKEEFYGVQITPIEDIFKEYSLNEIFVRKLSLDKILDVNLLADIHHQVHHQKYDLNIFDWLKAGIYQIEETENDKRPLDTKITDKSQIKKHNSYWCSALVGYIYIKMGWLDCQTEWSFLSPQDWSSNEKVKLPLKDCELENDINIKNL